jgi:broad specificity phosphatase PhoE
LLLARQKRGNDTVRATVTRRRIYLMRHAQVAYFEDGRPLRQDTVPLTDDGREQARAAAAVLEGITFDRVVTSGLPRTLETAGIVAPSVELESWPELREIEAGRLTDIPEDEIEQAFVSVWRDVVPENVRFLGGETIASLLDRVLPALERLLADREWDILLAVLHGGVNRAILSCALTGGRTFLGNFEQAPGCINVLDVGNDDWIVRAVGIAPTDLAHRGGRLRTMEELWAEFRPQPGA